MRVRTGLSVRPCSRMVIITPFLCSWKSKKIETSLDSDSESASSSADLREFLISYQPDAWYAFYVQTISVVQHDTRGAISKVVYAKSSFSRKHMPTHG
ncbi:unnamed protein product [Sphagnum balticum]